MELIDVLSTVLDLSNKGNKNKPIIYIISLGSEYNEEIANLNLTVMTLRQAL
jgi:hypothetical protein